MIYLALSQLISDSPSELAFAIGHELGHIYQFRNGGSRLYHTNPEFDADVWGTLLALASGYDPYGAAGALAKLAMATGKAGLTMQFEDQLSGMPTSLSILDWNSWFESMPGRHLLESTTYKRVVLFLYEFCTDASKLGG